MRQFKVVLAMELPVGTVLCNLFSGRKYDVVPREGHGYEHTESVVCLRGHGGMEEYWLGKGTVVWTDLNEVERSELAELSSNIGLYLVSYPSEPLELLEPLGPLAQLDSLTEWDR